MEFKPETFGQLNAADYDAANNPGTTDEAVELIAEVAGVDAKILEFAIGSGRLALPLLAKGFEVHGIEASVEMVELLRAKPQGDTIPVTIGDMASVSTGGQYDHVFLCFNTLFNLTSQAAQVACFENAACHLKPGGTFLVETFVPDLTAFTNNQLVRTMRMDMGSVWIEASQHDPLEQRFDMQRIRVTQEGMKLVPLVMRYAFPPEIDLMAKLAGLELENRWGGWDKSAFTAQSKMHISVYRRS